ncbi:TonB-dependent receptor [Comamonas aquatica]|uniref:TonB-dependent receptor plug domain-containing protein n=2 Tax=Comamonas aquatica TaxID=225991 RepID=UPI0024489E75|nr:TonB-dependent receptor [Comamonas aquatica]MDH0898624.1 TonB-dependent receptor [Comamonas aquatica]
MFPMNVFEQRRQRAWMPAMAWRPVSLAVVCLAGLVAPAAAAALDEVVVSATRSEQRLSDVLADVTVLDGDVLERSGALALEDVLAKVPGIQISRHGGPGTDTDLFLRGANKQHTAVYVDGIRIDAQNGSGGAPWESLSLESIERVEVLRGAAGAVYGSDAMAGAVQIFTRRGEPGFNPYVSVGAGTHGTQKSTAGFSGGQGAWDYALGLSYADSEGFDAKTGGPKRNVDKDGYVRKSANARVGLQLSASQRLDFTALTSDSNAGYDSRAQGDDRTIRSLDAYGLNWQSDWTPDVRTRVAVSQSRQSWDTWDGKHYHAETLLRNYLVHNEWRSRVGTFSVLAERREDTLENSSLLGGDERSRDQNALGLGYGVYWQQHAVQLNLRHDRDSDFGGKSTATLAYGWDFAPHWKATASVGTGFKVPTLFQRFSKNGDASLKPEESRNMELGLRWGNKDRAFSATAYRNRIENLVSYEQGSGTCPAVAQGCYLNVAEAQLEGITLAGNWRTGIVKWYASVDFQNPHDVENGRLLKRRSKRFATLGAETSLAGWTLGTEVQAASRRFNDDKETVKSLGGYTLVNLSASRQLAKDFTLTARIDNALDRDYTLAKDYATAGRTLWLGVKWMPW